MNSSKKNYPHDCPECEGVGEFVKSIMFINRLTMEKDVTEEYLQCLHCLGMGVIYDDEIEQKDHIDGH